MTGLKKIPRVFIVDDEKEVREILAEVVESMGYVVAHSGDGREALQRLKAESFDIIISDKNMPRYSGFQFLSDCHEAGIIKPFIFLTGDDAVENILKAVRLGAIDFLTKPIDFAQLEVTLKRASATADLWKFEDAIISSFSQFVDGNTEFVRKALREQLNKLRDL